MPPSALGVDALETLNVRTQPLGVHQRLFGLTQHAHQIDIAPRIRHFARPAATKLRVYAHIGADQRRRQPLEKGDPDLFDLDHRGGRRRAPGDREGTRAQVRRAPTQVSRRVAQPITDLMQHRITRRRAEHVVHGGQPGDVEQQRGIRNLTRG